MEDPTNLPETVRIILLLIFRVVLSALLQFLPDWVVISSPPKAPIAQNHLEKAPEESENHVNIRFESRKGTNTISSLSMLEMKCICHLV